MSTYLNTLYVTQPDCYLAKSHETVIVKQDGHALIQVPLHHLMSIVCLGSSIGVSPELMAHCCKLNISISFLSETGRFLGRVEGKQPGNVLLRRAQYRLADDDAQCAHLSKRFIQGKLSNCRTLLERFGRECAADTLKANLSESSARIADGLNRLKTVETVNTARGIEGEGAANYFSVFACGLKNPEFSFTQRSKRPPLDPVNSMLSFLYTILSHDCAGALASVGLDPQVGYLHVDRPGRPSLALDLMEEFRPVLVDRLVIRLINLKQVTPKDFTVESSGAVLIQEDTRKLLLSEYQKSKHEEITHPLLAQKIKYGLLPLLQARLLAKAIRGELESYPPYLLR